MQRKKENLFNVVYVKKHKAKKTYLCPDGVILPGQYYYRGFATYGGSEPFEFFFTNSDFIKTGNVPLNYLIESLKNYRGNKYKL